MKILIILLLILGAAHAAPLPPYSLILDRNEIQPIPIHSEIHTLLIFPSKVETITGHGLTTSEKFEGSVLYKHGDKNPKTIVLSHLDYSTNVLMIVLTADNGAFSFRLEPSEEPASIIHFTRPGKQIPKAELINEEEVALASRKPSAERFEEFLRLARDSRLLKPQLPQEYQGYSEKFPTSSSQTHGLQTAITKLARFENEDILLFFGRIKNVSSKAIHIGNYQGLLKVGKKRSYSPSILRTNKAQLAPGESATFEGLLLGNGRNQPLHLALNNNFTLNLTRYR